MADKKGFTEKLIELFMKQPTVEKSFDCSRVTFDFMSDGAFFYKLDGRGVTRCHSLAETADGRRLDTRTAKRLSASAERDGNIFRVESEYAENGLRLRLILTVEENSPWFEARAELRDTEKETESRFIAPLDFAYPNAQCDPLFLSLDQKMLLIPYDNDMWVRCESTPLRPGRTSYEVTAIYDEKNFRGMIVGALDFDCWKNAVRCSAWDARCYTAFSGVADAGTHDCFPHGTLKGESVSSSRFLCGMCDDIRVGMEEYGERAMRDKFSFKWKGGVPFGWNSFSALSMSLTLDHWKTTADFLYNELPEFHGEDGSVYVNLDANFGMNEHKMKRIIDSCHARGQRVGSYLAPLCAHAMLNMLPLRGSFGKFRKDTVMKGLDGRPFPAIDGSVPMDITLPEVEKDLRLSIRELVDRGFDYIKIDFLSHGAVEGPRHDPSVRTGRQAMKRFYDILAEELSPEKTGRDIFVSLSIAPLFPAGYGHSRRSCCDSFGHSEDVRYVLNALNFCWWASGTLYAYNDPDHTVLYNSTVDLRGPTDKNSARSRYNASVISGTVLLLSDNYGPTGNAELIALSRERAKEFANNARLNSVARIGRPFRPVKLCDGTCNAYFLFHDDRRYLALFNFENEPRPVSVKALDIGLPERGKAESLNDGSAFDYEDEVCVLLDGGDSVILELFNK